MTPSIIMISPPISSIVAIIDVQPLIMFGFTNFCTAMTMMVMNPTIASKIPVRVANLSGFIEKVVQPLIHRPRSFLRLYPELPDSLSFCTTSTLPIFLVVLSSRPVQ